jgi:hypothetical protein
MRGRRKIRDLLQLYRWYGIDSRPPDDRLYSALAPVGPYNTHPWVPMGIHGYPKVRALFYSFDSRISKLTG